MSIVTIGTIVSLNLSESHSSRMASTGLMAIARPAGANPASTPRAASRAAAPIAVQNETWK